MEQIEVTIGIQRDYDEGEDPRETVRFIGEKILRQPDPQHREHIQFTLFECPDGYRVLLELDVIKDLVIALVPSHKANEDYLLTKEEISCKFPFLSTTAGKLRDLDKAEIASPEKRERVANFARIMRLVHSY